MTLLGLVVGLPAEARTLARNHPVPGRIQELSAETLLAVSGIGPRRAQRAGEALIARGAAGILSWGIAGGLDPALGTGTLLLPDRVIGTEGRVFPADSGWRQRFREVLQGGPAAVTRPLAEASVPAADPASKRSLFEATRAAAVDMESAGAARAALGGGCPSWPCARWPIRPGWPFPPPPWPRWTGRGACVCCGSWQPSPAIHGNGGA